MTEAERLRDKILAENITLHRIEAKFYDRIHPEEFNWFEQGYIWKDLRFLRARMPAGSSVLDLGCGTGNLFLKLLGLGFTMRGVDISPDMAGILEQKIPPQAKDRAKVIVANVDEFIADCGQEFDCIVMSSVLHHLPDYIRTLEQALKLLKPGGWLYITHEPTREALAVDPFLRKILWQLDNIVYNAIFFRKTPVLEGRNFHLSDYHLYHCFDEDKVGACCRDSGVTIIKLRKYASAMRLGICCWFDSRVIASKRQFSLIGRKEL